MWARHAEQQVDVAADEAVTIVLNRPDVHLARSPTPELVPPSAPVNVPCQQKRALQQRSLGSERGLATPSPDGEGENNSQPFDQDHAA